MSAKQRVRIRAGGHLGEVLPFVQPDENVIMAVEQAVNLVMEGDIDAIAIAIVHRDGTSNNFYVGGSNLATLLGSTYRLLSRIQADQS